MQELKVREKLMLAAVLELCDACRAFGYFLPPSANYKVLETAVMSMRGYRDSDGDISSHAIYCVRHCELPDFVGFLKSPHFRKEFDKLLLYHFATTEECRKALSRELHCDPRTLELIFEAAAVMPDGDRTGYYSVNTPYFQKLKAISVKLKHISQCVKAEDREQLKKDLLSFVRYNSVLSYDEQPNKARVSFLFRKDRTDACFGMLEILALMMYRRFCTAEEFNTAYEAASRKHWHFSAVGNVEKTFTKALGYSVVERMYDAAPGHVFDTLDELYQLLSLGELRGNTLHESEVLNIVSLILCRWERKPGRLSRRI